jgi:hypothetical protein
VKYMFFMTFRPGEGPQEGTPEYDAEMKRWGEINEEAKQAGVYVDASGLSGPDGATTVRTRGGDLTVTDGPYAETKEVLFSYYIVDVPDLDAAIEWARKMPATEYGSIEIRPLV